MKSIMFMFACCAVISAGEAVQTDWSGGVSLESVVTEWGNVFSESQGISSTAVPGIICLTSTPFSSPIESVVNGAMPLSGMDAGDLDGDGFVDLVGASLVTDHVTWFKNLNGSSWLSVPLAGSFDGALGCSISDVDGDGHPDVLGGMDGPDMVVLWKNTDGSGPAGEPLVIDPLFPGVHCVIGCYVDDDGMMDIMGAANQCDQIAVWYNLGNDTWEKVVIDSTFTGTQSVSPGDFDGDGDLDAVGAALGLDEFAWWENPGNRTDPWEKHLVADGMTYAHHVTAVDMNEDGLMDVLGAVYGAAEIIWWENDGSTPIAWEAHTIAPNLTGTLTAIPADFDGDGDLDVAGTSWLLDRVMWYENIDGSGENWQNRIVEYSFNGAWPLACGDFTNNGRLQLAAGADVLTSPGTSHGVSVFDLCGFNCQGTLISAILDTEETPHWASFQFQNEVPSGTLMQFYWRSSNDYENMGDWIGPYTDCANLSGELFRYAQYKIKISATGALYSPILYDISLYWDPTGLTENSGDSENLVLLTHNPSCSGSVQLVTAEGCGQVLITLMDLSGRLIDSRHVYETGKSISFGPVPAGTYLVRAASGNRESAFKVLVLN